LSHHDTKLLFLVSPNGRTPDDVATFLAKTQGLDKTCIGEYLGDREDFHLKVRMGEGERRIGRNGKRWSGR
jgi:hypothetical protein